MLGQLGVELNLLLWILSDGLDNKVSVTKSLVPIGSELEVAVCALYLLFKLVELLWSNLVLSNEAVRVRLRIGLHSLKGVQIHLSEVLNLWTSALN